MINSYKDDPEANSAQLLSQKYKLDIETTYNILEYFQPFNLLLPKAESTLGNQHPLLRERRLKEAQKRLASAQKLVDGYSGSRPPPKLNS